MIDSARPTVFVQLGDREEGVRWYREVAGLSHLRADPFGDVFALGAAAELRLTAVPGFTPGPHPALGWAVADLPAAMAALRAKGVPFETFEGMGQDGDGVWTAPDGGTRLAWFKDCAGNLLVLSATG